MKEENEWDDPYFWTSFYHAQTLLEQMFTIDG